MLNAALSAYKYKYDLHVHTAPASPCAQVGVADMLFAYAELGYDGVVLTNHFNCDVFSQSESTQAALKHYFADYHLAKELAEKEGLDVILGAELRFPENFNDYLLYGTDEDELCAMYDDLCLSYAEFYKKYASEKRLFVQAHPFRDRMERQDVTFLDGAEVFNMHPGHNSRIAQAARFAHENPQLVITGGTDFHHPGHQGMCALCTKERIGDSYALARVLRTGDYIFDIWGQKVILRKPSKGGIV